MAYIKFVKEETNWKLVGKEIKTFHHFELFSERKLRCFCRRPLFETSQALLEDIPNYRAWKIKTIKEGSGTYQLPGRFLIMCRFCFAKGVGIMGKSIHHRVIIRYLRKQTN